MTENKNYRTQTPTRERDKLYSVFPGIWLMFQDVEDNSFSPWGKVPSGLLEITHCREGRLEYQDSHRAFVLGEGDLSIRQTRKEEAALLCPVKRYRGLSVLIHPEQAPPCTSCFLRDVNVSLAELYEKFCGEGRPFIMRATPQLEHIFAQLYQVPQSIQRGYFKVKVLELLLFLSCLEPAMSQGEQLRASVQQVYGKPLYQCIRAYKMRVAARLLRETDRTVLDIAGEFGYGNSSKFAAAFREVLGASPGEYRQKKSPSLWSEDSADWSGNTPADLV